MSGLYIYTSYQGTTAGTKKIIFEIVHKDDKPQRSILTLLVLNKNH